MDTITKWCVYLCLGLTTVTAFPYTRQPNDETNMDDDKHCSSVAVNKLLASLQLPLGARTSSRHARLRVKRDNTQSTDNVYLRRIMDDALTKLSNTEDELGSFRDHLSFTDSLDESTPLNHEMATLLSTLGDLKEKCLRNLETGSDVFLSEDDADDFLQSQASPTKGAVHGDVTGRAESEFGNTFGKRNDLAFNPSGWRKRRSSLERQHERLQHFLRNMRQLLDKRQEQRLNFNPSGW